MSEQRREIFELLADQEGKPLKPEAIANLLKKNPATIRRLLDNMYNDNEIRKLDDRAYFVPKGIP
jgi:Fe2+ or Zn2+ uptake regulation protein